MLPVGSLASNAAGVFGLMAAAIAVFGFLGQVPAALARKDGKSLRVMTVAGGLLGFFVADAIILMELW
jgi:hypothetical protein